MKKHNNKSFYPEIKEVLHIHGGDVKQPMTIVNLKTGEKGLNIHYTSLRLSHS